MSNLGFCFEFGAMSEAYREYLDEYVPQSWTDDNHRLELSNGRTIDEQVDHIFAPRQLEAS